AQTVIVQEQALRAASEKLERLEAENRDLRAHGGGAPPQQQGGFLSGLGGLFGGGQQPASPPPAPRQGSPWGAAPQGGGWSAPQQAQAPWGGAPQQQGGGFLKGALGAAAGVAGGVLLADSIRGLFHGPGMNPYGIGTGGSTAGFGGGETIVNNYYGDDSGLRQASDDGYARNDGYSNDDNYQSDADYSSDDSSSDDSSYDV
ncbi:MAG: DUF2076 family protein, partial [Hyphomicrobiales bacterium]|nr:DUF2076 family protein [Hyphomicrobiales bacterium]